MCICIGAPAISPVPLHFAHTIVGGGGRDLNQQFRAGLNMAMSGIVYWTTDIGGYAGGNISSPAFHELVVRWFQWGAFCPLFRNHGRRSGGPSQEGGNPVCGDTKSSNEVTAQSVCG